MKNQSYWKSFLGVVLFIALGIAISCTRNLAPTTGNVNTPTPTRTATPTKTNTPAGPTATPTVTNTPCGYPGNTCTFTVTSTPTNTPAGPTATPTVPVGAVMFDDFDTGGGAQGSYTYPTFAGTIPSWLAATFNQGTNTQTVHCVTTTSYSATHSMETAINFGAPGDVAELGLYDWASYGGPVDASTATNYFSFWARATGPVTVASIFMCSGGCVPEIGKSGINISLPGDSAWHNYVVPLGSPDPTINGWVFTNGSAPWDNAGVVEVFFDMTGPVGPVTVNYDNISFYP